MKKNQKMILIFSISGLASLVWFLSNSEVDPKIQNERKISSFDSSPNIEVFEDDDETKSNSTSLRKPSKDDWDSKEEYFTKIKNAKTKYLKVYEEILRDSLISESYQKLAFSLINQSDGHLKEVGLLIAATQEPHEQIFNSILKNVILYHDKTLIQQSFLELTRYLGNEDYHSSFYKTLIEALNHGSLMVLNKIIANLHLLQDQGHIDLRKIIPYLNSAKHQKIIFNIAQTR